VRTISKKAKYGLRALYALARHYGQGPVMVGTLAKEEAIPKKFLELILLELKHRGVVASRKGKLGGYQLNRPPSEITLGSVIRIMDGPLAPLPCASETAYQKCEECVDEKSCGTRLVMRQVRDATAQILDNTTLADVCRQIEASKEKSGDAQLMYYI
jgi:Rrf2 family protein